MKLSVIMPCYNEIGTIQSIVEKVASLELPLEHELVVVDDCSTDGTREYLIGVNGRADVQAVLAR